VIGDLFIFHPSSFTLCFCNERPVTKAIASTTITPIAPAAIFDEGID
jgi:hypothetical protein